MSEQNITRFRFINEDYKPEGDKEILSKSINSIGLSLETVKALEGEGFRTVEDLCKCQMRFLYRIKKLKKKNVFEILRKLQSFNLNFMFVENKQAVENKQPQNNEVIKEKNNKQNSKQEKKNKPNKENKNIEGKNKQELRENQIKDRDNKQAQKHENNKTNKNDNKKQIAKQNNNEPKRVKINSYDVDLASNSFNFDKIKKLKEERSKRVSKLISQLPPLKNADNLYKFYQKGKWGYKDGSGKVVIEPKYNEAFNFKEGLACVEMDEKCGFIDKNGNVVIDFIYDTACSFSEGVASVTKNDKCAYIDKEGNLVYDFIFEAATSFENGISLVKKDGKWGYMDKITGEIRLR